MRSENMAKSTGKCPTIAKMCLTERKYGSLNAKKIDTEVLNLQAGTLLAQNTTTGVTQLLPFLL